MKCEKEEGGMQRGSRRLNDEAFVWVVQALIETREMEESEQSEMVPACLPASVHRTHPPTCLPSNLPA